MMLSLEETRKAFSSFINSPDQVKEAIKCSQLVQQAYQQKYIKHYFLGLQLNVRNMDQLAISILNTNLHSGIDGDGGILIDFKATHRLCEHLSTAYSDTVPLGKVGIIIFTVPEINTALGYPEKCIYPELEKELKSKQG